MMNDPYSVLGVSAAATDDEVKRAYRDLARKYHPDNYQNNPLADLAEEKMKEVNEAYDAITRMRDGSGASAGAYQQGGYRQSTTSSDPVFARVRALINAGGLDEAEQILQNAPSRGAEWHFLAGSIAYRRGWLDEARQNYQIAVQMDPSNPEYRQALAYMQNAGGMYRNYGGAASSDCDSADVCTSLMCLNCLCRGGRC